jgi:hypothetical protein
MARERSPNYPAYGLSAALQFVRLVWSVEKRTSVTMDVLATALGSIGVSGAVRSKVAAMRQYGLLVPAGDGLRVSDRAITLLLQHPGEPEYDEVVKDVALSPPLFGDLWSERPDASEAALNYHLVKNLKFSTDGAKRVIKSYQETLAFAKLGEGSYTEVDEQRGAEPRAVTGPGAVATRPVTGEGVAKVSFVFALPRGVSAEVIFHGSAPTKRAVEKLRAYLELFADDLPEDDPQAATEQNAVAELETLRRDYGHATDDLNAELRRSQRD